MMKHRLVGLFLALTGSVGLVTAQSSQVRSSSSTTSSTSKVSSQPDSRSLKSASAPLTPKSAMPRSSKSSVAVPAAPKNNQNELSRLERQNIKASTPKGSSTAPTPKIAPAKSASASSGSMDFKYQKPAGGLTSARPDAHSANPTTPRVTKKN